MVDRKGGMMNTFKGRVALLGISFVLAATACSSGASGATSSTSPANGGASASVRPTDIPVAVQQWSVNAPTTIPAGTATFAITNTGTMEHEFVVYQTDTAAADIPIASFEGEKDRINEDTNGTNLGESGDLDPGGTATLTVDLPPGHYVFFCNLPSHYRLGMHLDVTVQ